MDATPTTTGPATGSASGAARTRSAGRATFAMVVSVGLAGAALGGLAAVGAHVRGAGHDEVLVPPASGPLAGGIVGAAAEDALATGVRWMLPRMVAREGRARARDAWQGALASAISEAPASLREVYAGRPATLTTEDGLTEAGRRALRYVEAARHHGLLRWDARIAEVREAVGDLTRAAAPVERLASPPAASLVLAWRSDHGGAEPLAGTARALGTRHADIDSATRAFADRTLGSAGRQARAEAALAAAVLDAATLLVHRPRTEPVLESEEGRYLPPEVLVIRPHEPLPTADVASLFEALVEGDEALQAWTRRRLPSNDRYGDLVGAAERYASLCDAGGFPEVAVPKEPRGNRWKDEAAVRALQERLALEGFFDGDPSGRFDDGTGKALVRYHDARNLKALPVFGPETAAALNVPCEERLATLHLNLRRMRHAGRTDQKTFVEVVLPAFEARFVVDGTLRRKARTVVGAGRWFWDDDDEKKVFPKSTPTFMDAISQVVVNPSWSVPASIRNTEFKRKLAKNPNWYEENGYVVKTTASGYEIVVQVPSDKNTLGQVKMLFPNSESIYMHDTSQRSFFEHPRRDFSHGCVRVQDALDFATDLLVVDRERAGERWDPRRLHVLAKDDDTRFYNLYEPVPVFFEYLTATVDDGVVRFHPDIYEFDGAARDGEAVKR